jgi:hypothetical protein
MLVTRPCFKYKRPSNLHRLRKPKQRSRIRMTISPANALKMMCGLTMWSAQCCCGCHVIATHGASMTRKLLMPSAKICPLYYTPKTIAKMSLNDLGCPAVQIVSLVQVQHTSMTYHLYIVDEPALY